MIQPRVSAPTLCQPRTRTSVAKSVGSPRDVSCVDSFTGDNDWSDDMDEDVDMVGGNSDFGRSGLVASSALNDEEDAVDKDGTWINGLMCCVGGRACSCDWACS